MRKNANSIKLSVPQTILCRDLTNKIYWDRFNEQLDVFNSKHIDNLIDFFRGQDRDLSIGRNNILELKTLYQIVEDQEWDRFHQFKKRGKTEHTLDVISELSGQGSWRICWGKKGKDYEEIWEEMLEENGNQHWVASLQQRRKSKERELEVKLDFIEAYTKAIRKADLTSEESEAILKKALSSIRRLGRGR